MMQRALKLLNAETKGTGSATLLHSDCNHEDDQGSDILMVEKTGGALGSHVEEQTSIRRLTSTSTRWPKLNNKSSPLHPSAAATSPRILHLLVTEHQSHQQYMNNLYSTSSVSSHPECRSGQNLRECSYLGQSNHLCHTSTTMTSQPELFAENDFTQKRHRSNVTQLSGGMFPQ